MDITKKNFVIIAGEASGDMHAAHLVSAIHRINPLVTFSGLGGSQMASAGVDLFEDLTKFAVVGFFEVLKHYGAIRKTFYRTLKRIDEIRPDAVILVDYPGFNLRLAKRLKKRGFKIIYYISPQVWAWKEKRVELVKKYIDHMLVLFSFEKEFYTRHGITTHFVGHPLLDQVRATVSRDQFLKDNHLQEYRHTIGLLPGSRQKEVKILLPIMLNAAQRIQKKFPMLQFLVMNASTINKELIDEYLKKSSLNITVVKDQTYNGINACDICLVASGTATLETAILEKPMVVTYKTSLVTWLLAKIFIKIPHIGLVNVVAGKKIVPECIQFQATGAQLAKKAEEILTNELKISDIKTELKKVRDLLGSGAASQRAAEKILEVT